MSTVRYCPHCGSEVFYDGDFCVNCGGTLEGPDPRASDTPTQAIPQRSTPMPPAFTSGAGHPTRRMSRREFIQNAQMESVNGSADLAALAASTSSFLAQGGVRHDSASAADGPQPATAPQDAPTPGETARAEGSAARSSSSGTGEDVSTPTQDRAEHQADQPDGHPDIDFALDWASDTWGIPSLPEGIWSLDSSLDAAGKLDTVTGGEPNADTPGGLPAADTHPENTPEPERSAEPAMPDTTGESVDAAAGQQAAAEDEAATGQLPAIEPQQQIESAEPEPEIESADPEAEPVEPASEPAQEASAAAQTGSIPQAAPQAADVDADTSDRRQAGPANDADVPTQVIARADVPADTGPLPYNIPSAEMTGRTAAAYTPATTTSGMPAIDIPDEPDTDMATVAVQQGTIPDEAGTQVMPQAHAATSAETGTPAAPRTSSASAKRWKPVVAVGVAAVLCVCVGLGISAARRHALPASTAQATTSAATGTTATPASPSASSSPTTTSPSATATPSAAGVYTNSAMGYQVSIPDGYVWHDETDNGASRTFTDDSIGMTIAVSGKANASGATVSSEYAACASGHAVSYHLLSGDIMVCSYAQNGTITYIKEIVTRSRILTLRFDYPQSAKTNGSSVIDQVFPSFVSTQ